LGVNITSEERAILLDLMMPEMDGFAFFRALRGHPGGQEVPVVVLTAKDVTEEDSTRLRGATRVLSKDDTSLHDLADELRRVVPLGAAVPSAALMRP
jgi:CheY-like chemotaxis protein